MGIIILLSIFIIAVVMTVKEIKEGMTAPEVAQTIKDNFDALNTEKETVVNVGKVKESVDNANKNTGVSNYPAFSATENVAVGVVRNYNGLLYRRIVAGANEWNEANWERVSLESLQNEKLTELARQVIYDVSANNDGATFASLSALLSSENLSTLIPTAVRCGGMSIRFVQSSDNKYVQYRYMSSSTAVADFTNVANWQGVDDEPTAGSDNLVKSRGITSFLGVLAKDTMNFDGDWDVSNINLYYHLPQGNYLFYIKASSDTTYASGITSGTILRIGRSTGTYFLTKTYAQLDELKQGIKIYFTITEDNYNVNLYDRLVGSFEYAITKADSTYIIDGRDILLSSEQSLSDSQKEQSRTNIDVFSTTEVNELINSGYLFKGIATPLTYPSIPTSKEFWFATQAGIYGGFNRITITDGYHLNIIKWDGTAWSSEIVCATGIYRESMNEMFTHFGSGLSTVVGEAVEVVTSSSTRSDNYAIISGLVEGDTFVITGLSGSSRAWSKVSNGIVTELINTDSNNVKTITVVCDGTFDSLALPMRTTTLYPFNVVKLLELNKLNLICSEDFNTKEIKKKLNVLLMGSSFGVSTIMQFPALAKSMGLDITVGNLYTGNIGLAEIKTICENNGIFATGRINTGNGWGVSTRYIREMLELCQWDIIILQNSAPNYHGAGGKGSDRWDAESEDALEYILQYIQSVCTNSPKILFNSTFSRPVGYFNGNRELQEESVEAINNACRNMQSQFGIDIIPEVTAIQNARTTSLSYVQTNNSYSYAIPDLAGTGDHIDTGLGSYITACVLFEKICGELFGMSILNSNFVPVLSDVQNDACGYPDEDFTETTEEQRRIAKYCALCAIRNPFVVDKALGVRFPYPNT